MSSKNGPPFLRGLVARRRGGFAGAAPPPCTPGTGGGLAPLGPALFRACGGTRARGPLHHHPWYIIGGGGYRGRYCYVDVAFNVVLGVIRSRRIDIRPQNGPIPSKNRSNITRVSHFHPWSRPAHLKGPPRARPLPPSSQFLPAAQAHPAAALCCACQPPPGTHRHHKKKPPPSFVTGLDCVR